MRNRLTFLAAFLLFVAVPVAPAKPVIYLVFPPENLCKAPSLSWVGEAVALSVSDQLRMPGLEVLGRDERINFVQTADLPSNTPLSYASMIHVAQQAGADRLVTGSYSGVETNLKVSLHVLDMKSLKLGGELAAGGPMETLPQMENELAWGILDSSGLNAVYSRQKFIERTRAIPNAAYAAFIQGLSRSEPDEQISLFKKAVGLYPDFTEANFLLGRYFYRQGDCAGAIQHLEKVGSAHRDYLENQFIVGNCHLKQNENAAAVRAYSTILSFTSSAQVLNNEGVANMRKGDLTLAAQNLVEAHALAPRDPTIGINLALVRHLQGNEPAARDLILELEPLHPNRGMAQYLLSLVLDAQGEKEKSSEASVKAERLGADLNRLRSEDARGLARIFTSWESAP